MIESISKYSRRECSQPQIEGIECNNSNKIKDIKVKIWVH